jgi:hypothetical protein
VSRAAAVSGDGCGPAPQLDALDVFNIDVIEHWEAPPYLPPGRTGHVEACVVDEDKRGAFRAARWPAHEPPHSAIAGARDVEPRHARLKQLGDVSEGRTIQRVDHDDNPCAARVLLHGGKRRRKVEHQRSRADEAKNLMSHNVEEVESRGAKIVRAPRT